MFDISSPRWVVLQVTEKCNLNCKMCYEWGEKGFYKNKENLHELKFDIIKDIVESLKIHKPNYDLFGGEPLLHPQFEKIVQLIKRTGSQLNIPTNGTLLNRYYKTIVDEEVDNLWISLDGPKDINDYQRGDGTYNKILDGLKTIYNYKIKTNKCFPKIGISSVITPSNYKYIYEFYKNFDLNLIEQVSLEFQTYLTSKDIFNYRTAILKSFGEGQCEHLEGYIQNIENFKSININELTLLLKKTVKYLRDNGIYVNTYPQNMNFDNSNKYFNAKWMEMSDLNKICPFPYIVVEVNAHGDVTPCHTMYDLTFGNVYNENILTIWNGEKIRKFRNLIRKGMLPNCPACCLFYNKGIK